MTAKQTGSNSCAIIFKSCDLYQDTWTPFFQLFERFWPDCTFPKYHISNHAGFSWPGVQMLRVGPESGPERSWSDTLLAGLAQVKEPFVLMILDDLFLLRSVANSQVSEAVDWLIANNGNHLRLNGFPKPEVPVNSMLGEIPTGTVYRTSTVVTVWRKEVFCELLQSDESIWNFEMAGAVRSDAYPGFYSTTKPLLLVENTIIKGKWRRVSIRRIRRLGIDLDLTRRPVMTYQEDWKIRLRMLINIAFCELPGSWKRRIHSAFRRKGYVQPFAQFGAR